MKNLITSTVKLSLHSPMFADHFPGTPILPAFRQLQLVREIIGKHGKNIASFQNVKFLHPISPDREFRLEIGMQHGFADFQILDAQQVMTKGRAIVR